MVLLHLALSNFKVRKVRMALTLAAIALSVSLVVAVTTGYKSMEGMALKFLNQYMGAADVMIVPGDEFALVPEKLVKELAADPDVRQVVGRLESDREMDRAAGQAGPAQSAERLAAGAIPSNKIAVELIGVRRPDDTTIQSLDLRDGRWFKTAQGNEAVVDQVAAEKIGVGIGDEITVPGIKKLTLRIVGIVHKPVFFSQHTATIYLPIETLQHFAGEDNPPLVSSISVSLRDKVDSEAFQKRWTERLRQIDPSLRLRARRQSSGELEKNLRGVQIASYLSGTISMLTATFIVFSALSMGVSERQRTLAMLRAIGAVRAQVFQLVILEAVALAAVGIAAGIPLGMLWMWLLNRRFAELFAAGLIPSYPGMLFAAGGSFLTALLASVLPAWWASRISPLDAMNAHAAPPVVRPPILWALAGAILAGIDPFLFFGPVERILTALGLSDPAAATETVRFVGHFVLGLPGIMIGFFLTGADAGLGDGARSFAPAGRGAGAADTASSPATQHRHLARCGDRSGADGWTGDADRHAGAGPHAHRRLEAAGQVSGHIYLESGYRLVEGPADAGGRSRNRTGHAVAGGRYHPRGGQQKQSSHGFDDGRPERRNHVLRGGPRAGVEDDPT